MRTMFPETFALIASYAHDNNAPIYIFIGAMTSQIEMAVVTEEVPLAIEETVRESSVEASERKVETIQIPGTEVELAPEKPEVSPLPHTARETSVGKLMPSVWSEVAS